MGRIVVGVDGSELSMAALRWALEEARLRHATLDVVHAWTFPVYGDGITATWVTRAADELEEGARSMLRQTLEAVDTRGVDVSEHVACGPPGSALVAQSKGADLLVVGNRGRGDLQSFLLGSVSHHVVHHASCPVVIVRN
jgi:nucleotide-binding universal stress UspA family protein